MKPTASLLSLASALSFCSPSALDQERSLQTYLNSFEGIGGLAEYYQLFPEYCGSTDPTELHEAEIVRNVLIQRGLLVPLADESAAIGQLVFEIGAIRAHRRTSDTCGEFRVGWFGSIQISDFELRWQVDCPVFARVVTTLTDHTEIYFAMASLNIHDGVIRSEECWTRDEDQWRLLRYERI